MIPSDIKEDCPECKGWGIRIDGNSIQIDEPCDYCCGTGYIYLDRIE